MEPSGRWRQDAHQGMARRAARFAWHPEVPVVRRKGCWREAPVLAVHGGAKGLAWDHVLLDGYDSRNQVGDRSGIPTAGARPMLANTGRGPPPIGPFYAARWVMTTAGAIPCWKSATTPDRPQFT